MLNSVNSAGNGQVYDQTAATRTEQHDFGYDDDYSDRQFYDNNTQDYGQTPPPHPHPHPAPPPPSSLPRSTPVESTIQNSNMIGNARPSVSQTY